MLSAYSFIVKLLQHTRQNTLSSSECLSGARFLATIISLLAMRYCAPLQAKLMFSGMVMYIVSEKNVPPLTCYNFYVHHPITIILGRSATEKEDSALVLYACNTVQLLQRSRLPFS